MVLLWEVPPNGIFYRKPGACHKARFMARFMAFCLYVLKMLLFIRQMKLVPEAVEGLLRLGMFFVTIYIPYFLKASIGADAAVNDLALYKALCNYIDVDGPIVTAALEVRLLILLLCLLLQLLPLLLLLTCYHAHLQVLSRHGWYTCQQTMVYSLFSHKVTLEQKSRIASRILTFEVPEQYRLGKPVFQELTESTELQDLVGPYSHMIFTILGTDKDWLAQDPASWQESESYREMEDYVRNVKVTNDMAERGIKMATDYSKILTKNPEMRKKLLQGVEMSRKIHPDMKKTTMNTNERW